MKKGTLLALLLSMAMTLTACVSSDMASYYETAQFYLGCGEYADAAELFAQLGEYEDSAEYALYAAALQAIKAKEYGVARANLMAVNPFKSSGRYLMYLDALAAEEAGELDNALALYEKLGTFCDAHLAVERLEEAIPEAAIKEGRALMAKGEYDAARELFLSLDGYGASATLAENCTAAMNKAAYKEAEELEKSGDLLGAMAAFTALGDSLDAAKRADKCLTAMHAALDAQYANVNLSTAPALLAAYEALAGDAVAQSRAAELIARFGKNLDLMSRIAERPCVQMGKYPAAESGEEKPVLWRVIKAEDTVLTLLSDTVLDASAAAEMVALMLTGTEQAAVEILSLPSMADLSGLLDLTCLATPYALAQGTSNENGLSSYWLRDSLENGLHPIIGATGVLTLPGDTLPGVRPMMTINLEKLTFTNGSGTAEDPFRVE